MANYKAVYRGCISDIEGIKSLFDHTTGRCRDLESARQRMPELKAGWGELKKQYWGTEAESVVREALTRIEVKSNSTPNQQWLDDLISAEIDLKSYL